MDTIRKQERKNWFYSYNMIFEQKISEHAKLIYLYLCRCADNDGQSFPSQTTIADKCSISRRTVVSALQELEEIGLLSRQARTKENGGQTSNLYTIYDSPTATPVQEMHTPCARDAHPPVQEMHTPCARDAHEVLPKEVLSICKDYSVSQSRKMTDRQTDELHDIKFILEERLEIQALKENKNTELVEELELNIMEMYLQESTTIKGDRKPKTLIQGVINKLNYLHLEMIIDKFMEISKTTKIKNNKAYLQTLIYNAPFETRAEIENQVKFDMGY